MEDTKIEQGIQLLRMASRRELSVKEVVAIIEVVTKDPRIIRETINQAEMMGLIRRREGRIRIREVTDFNGEEMGKIRHAICEDNCKSCGKRITHCYYIDVLGHTFGPFGSKCIKKLNLVH